MMTQRINISNSLARVVIIHREHSINMSNDRIAWKTHSTSDCDSDMLGKGEKVASSH